MTLSSQHCKMGREVVAARIDVDGWVEGLNKEGFFNASFHPILIRREDGDIFFSEVVAVLACMLEHGRFVVAKSIGRGGEMLLETSANCSLGLTDIRAWA